MTIHCYPIPFREFDERAILAHKSLIDVQLSTEGLHVLLKFRNDADRLTAAMTLSEAAKSYGNSLLLCANTEDENLMEMLRFLREDLAVPMTAYRFLWVQSPHKFEMAVARALMPFGPVNDPRGVWERLD